jgi:hypothetical protein
MNLKLNYGMNLKLSYGMNLKLSYEINLQSVEFAEEREVYTTKMTDFTP